MVPGTTQKISGGKTLDNFEARSAKMFSVRIKIFKVVPHFTLSEARSH